MYTRLLKYEAKSSNNFCQVCDDKSRCSMHGRRRGLLYILEEFSRTSTFTNTKINISFLKKSMIHNCVYNFPAYFFIKQRNSVWFKCKYRMINTSTSHSIRQETEIHFSACKLIVLNFLRNLFLWRISLLQFQHRSDVESSERVVSFGIMWSLFRAL